ncbi:hypothetical protein [Microbacterium sp. RURRCA19A]|uniref:hypothetical protein n=1 Tax=Microbacterium sp. RURRCA19A TaxID=1907391 RepID=UPI000953CBAB|nr:hypothetical protein [Microbacterium sp. RURRCA19A]SIR78578.1 hypothetical protein SAMN05880568_1460 [Microbacterium sp. RURRCA19A]
MTSVDLGTARKSQPTVFPADPGKFSRSAVVGSALGLSAASVGLSWSVGSLNLSTFFLLVGFALAVFLRPPGTVLGYRLRFFDLIAIVYAASAVAIENFDAMDLGHPPSPGYAYGALYYFAAYLVARLMVQGVESFAGFLSGLVWPSIIVSILGVLQLARVGPVMDFLLNQTTSSSLANRVALGASIRATSTIGHWTALGAYLCAILACACILLILGRKTTGQISAFALAAIISSAAGIVSTLTFASIFVAIALIIVTAVLAGVGTRLMALLGVGSIVAWAVFGTLISERLDKQATATSNIPDDLRWLPQTIAYRVVLWNTEGIPSWLERPLTGWGQGVYKESEGWLFKPRALMWPAPESEWIKALVGSGLIGLVVLLLFLFVMLGTMMAAQRGVLGRAVAPAVILMICLLVVSAIAPYFTGQGAPMLLWPLVGALMWSIGAKVEPHRGGAIGNGLALPIR